MNISNLLVLLGLCALTVSAADAPVLVTREEAADMKSADVQTVVERLPQYLGKVVRLKFNYRDAQTIPDTVKNTIGSGLGIHRAQTTVGSTARDGHLTVTIPNAGENWFLKLSTSPTNAITYTVIARISRGEASEATAELLGREMTMDFKGVKLSW